MFVTGHVASRVLYPRPLQPAPDGRPAGGDRDIYLGVNMSRRQLSDPFFFDRLDKILRDTDFDRRQLKRTTIA